MFLRPNPVVFGAAFFAAACATRSRPPATPPVAPVVLLAEAPPAAPPPADAPWILADRPLAESGYRAAVNMISFTEDGEEYEDYRTVVIGPDGAVVWHGEPVGSDARLVVRSDGQAVLAVADDFGVFLVRPDAAVERIGEAKGTIDERALHYDADDPPGVWVLDGPHLYEGDLVGFRTRTNWELAVSLQTGQVDGRRVPQPFAVERQELVLHDYFIGFGDPAIAVSDQAGLMVTVHPGARDPAAVLTSGDYEAERVDTGELAGRPVAFGRHMVTMGCAVAGDTSVVVFEMNPSGVSGCDMVLLPAPFEPLVRAVFGGVLPGETTD